MNILPFIHFLSLFLSLCSWLRFCLNWLLVITYWWWWWVLIRHSFRLPCTYLDLGFLLWEPRWSCDHPKPPHGSNRLQSQRSFDLKILPQNIFLSLSPDVICSISFLILISKEEHLYCSFLHVLFPWVLEFSIQRWNRCVSVCMYLGRDLSWGLEAFCGSIPQKSINNMKKKTLFKHKWPQGEHWLCSKMDITHCAVYTL